MSLLTGAYQFNDRQFQRAQLERLRADQQSAVDEITGQLKTSDEMQKRLAEEQNKQLDILGEIQTLLAESNDDLAQAQRDVAETQKRLAEESSALQKQIAADIQRAISDLTAAIETATSAPAEFNESAGGTLGRGSPRRRRVRQQRDWNTGDVKVTFASGSYPNGWVVCDGTELGISAFPELYDHVRRTWGTPSRSDTFKLPTAAEVFTGGVEAEFVVLMRV